MRLPKHRVTLAAHGYLYATPIRKLDHLCDVVGRAGFQYSDWPPMNDLPEVRGSGLPRGVVSQQCAAEVLQFVA
jgi:hypothetical protein